ncbi:MAG: pyridoxamine 5'-phosphate oxidase family protein [Saprospiraceae bacterium]|nr:pyridoxamine 5'-phosphate oxidase family protein [Saprospiraceae bacterium]MCB9343495.1 pyridoxamine 5'-phosphate oxidase family protein [Lewinellaceae bacterium]
MTLTKEIKDSIDKSVLCWLATASADNWPSVSPKEIFTCFGTDQLIIANIASPQSVRNVRENELVCVSFIDILVQKGYQLKGKARVIEKTDLEFLEMEKPLLEMTGGNFPFNSIIVISIESAKPIIAPRYMLYPETTQEEQIESARKSYGL